MSATATVPVQRHVAQRKLARIKRLSTKCAVIGLIGVGGGVAGLATHDSKLEVGGWSTMYGCWAVLVMPIGNAEKRAKAEIKRLGPDTTVSGP